MIFPPDGRSARSDLSSNNIGGVIPPELGYMTSLATLCAQQLEDEFALRQGCLVGTGCLALLRAGGAAHHSADVTFRCFFVPTIVTQRPGQQPTERRSRTRVGRSDKLDDSVRC